MQERQWVFTRFRLEPANARLWRATEAVVLRPKVFAVLCYLVEHPGRLVTKEELLDAVWQHRFVSESVLKDCINQLRKVLDDDPKAPRYIETAARRGYRFVAAVTAAAGERQGPPRATRRQSSLRAAGWLRTAPSGSGARGRSNVCMDTWSARWGASGRWCS